MAEHGPTFRLRVLSALVLVPVALAVVTAGGWIYVLGVALLVTLMALEWRRLSEVRFGPRYGRFAGAATLASAWAPRRLPPWADRGRRAVRPDRRDAGRRGGAGTRRGRAVGRHRRGTDRSARVALVWLRSVPELGLGLLLWLLIVVWTTDTAAYASDAGSAARASRP